MLRRWLSLFLPTPPRRWLSLFLPALLLASQANADHTQHKVKHAHLAPFAPKGTPPRYARDLPYLIQHLRLDLTIHPHTQRIQGEAQLRMSANARPLSEISLDAAELQIQQIWVNQRIVRWVGQDHKLHIQLGAIVGPKQPFFVRITYHATPRTGLHFIRADKDYPNKPMVVFSQGESQYNRFWYPSFDTTNMRFTSETRFTVPKGFDVITNGRLISRTTQGEWTTVHHLMEQTHVNYLLSVVIGKFAVYAQSWDGIPIRSFVHPNDIQKAPLSFQNTPDMMKFFSEKLAFRYPYAKYDQVTVPDFMAGGMENISATTLTDGILHDERAHLDRRSDDLVAHELAHQWFGDLLTCKDWSHIWLNESFATYFNHLYTEHKFGRDDFDAQRLFSRERYLHHSPYQRPIVTRRYFHPSDVFDGHSYPKGAAVLHMIRRRLGETLWWKAIQHYVKRHAFGLVETDDLRRALEDISGDNWEPFFDQWIYRAGHPVLDFSWKYDAKNKIVIATIQQKTKQPYTLETALTIFDAAQTRRILPISLHKSNETITFPAHQRPQLIEFDASSDLLAVITAQKSWQESLFQLQHGSSLLSRLRAARSLRKHPNQETVRTALKQTLLQENLHWSLRNEAAHTLAHLRQEADCIVLQTALHVKEARTRAAIAHALGRCKQIADSSFPLLANLLRNDLGYSVRSAATASIAALRHASTWKLLLEAYAQTLDNGSIRIAALQGMIALEDPRALPILQRSLQRGQPRFVRLTALTGFAKLAKFFRQTPQAADLDTLLPHLQDPDSFVRNTTVYALGILADTRAIPHLRRFAEHAPTANRSRDAQRAIEAITQQDALKQRLQSLGSSLEAIRKEQRKLIQRLKKMEGIRYQK